MTQAATTNHTLSHGLCELYPEEAALAVSELPAEEGLAALTFQPPEIGAEIFALLNPDFAVGVTKLMDEEVFRAFFTRIDPIHAAVLLSRIDDDEQSARLRSLPKESANELREIMDYPSNSAGALMDSRVTIFRSGDTVSSALDQIRAQKDRRLTDLCLLDERGHLESVLSLREVAVAGPDELLGSLVRGEAHSAPATAQRDAVVELMEANKLASVPVVSFDGRLLGIIRYDTLVEVAQQDASESLQAMVGAGREERALSKPIFAIRKRLPWLQVNLATAFLAASVVALFEDTIARFTALAVFLPVVAGQSGNTGAQALAVTMRGLALREIRVRHWPRIAGKEGFVGLVNGVAIAATTAGIVYLWEGSVGIPIVLGLSMVFSMVMAGVAGAVIPVVLTSLRQDPAQSASIVLTTVTDVVGFMSFLGLATFLSSSFNLQL